MAFYKANDKYSALLTAGYTVGQNTLYVSAVPENVPTIVVAAKGTDKETVFAVTGKTTNSLTGVTRLRGANVDLDAQTPITCLNNEEFINQLSGAVFTPESLVNLIYTADGGSSDDYAISLDPAPAEYKAGMLVAFKANTTNTGAATLNVNNLGAKSIKKNGNEDLADGDIKAGQVVVVVYDGTNFQLQSPSPERKPPQGYMINGKIVPSVASGNLTVAIKTLDGSDPSASNPVFVNIGGTVRTISSSLSVSRNAGTNWFNAGSSELATYEIDYFVYLGYNATDGITLGFARIPYATKYGDFSTTSTNERYAAISNTAHATSSDVYELVGRFNATLSAGSAYSWSLPSTQVVLSRPIKQSRVLTYAPVCSGYGSMTWTINNRYKQVYWVNDDVFTVALMLDGTTGGTANNRITFTLPFSQDGNWYQPVSVWSAGAGVSGQCEGGSGNSMWAYKYDKSNFALGANTRVCGVMTFGIIKS